MIDRLGINEEAISKDNKENGSGIIFTKREYNVNTDQCAICITRCNTTRNIHSTYKAYIYIGS